MTIPFGPVPSRRLGRSLGINHIPPKTCSYACVYCQLGRTRPLRVRPSSFFPPEQVLDEVARHVALLRGRGEPIDYLTFVPDGEPTLDRRLGEAIDLLKRSLSIPVAVISNGSLLWRDEARIALSRADWVSLKVDACREHIWRRVNRPHGRLSLGDIGKGVRAFAGSYGGRLVTETMLVAHLNDGVADIAALATFLGEISPHTAYLSVPTRPPAEPWVRAPEESTVNRAFQILSGTLKRVELLIGHEGSDFAFGGRAREELLAAASVHPMREDSLRLWLEKAGADWSLVTDLLARRALVETEFQGWKFYIRNLHDPST